MKNTVNIGMIGYKFMGKAHSNGFTQFPLFFDAGAKVVKKAICGRDEAGVKEAMERYGWESYETDYKKLVSRPDIDAIDVTAPSNAHKPIVMEALANGKHVFCEKPLALNLADAREMLEAAKKAGVVHQIGFNYRFAPAIQLAKKLIDEGRLGKIYHFRGKYLQDWIIDPMFPMVWRLDKAVCGSGTLGDLGAHVIDMAAYLVGDIKEVTGMSRTFVDKRPVVSEMRGLSGKAEADAPMGDVTVDDATVFCASFECGALGTFESTRFAAGHKNDMSFEINGELGSIKFEFERMNELWFCDFTEKAETQGFTMIQASDECHSYAGAFWPVGHVLGYENTFAVQLYEFTKAIANGTQAMTGFEAGVKVAQIMDAVDLSIERRAWVDVGTL